MLLAWHKHVFVGKYPGFIDILSESVIIVVTIVTIVYIVYWGEPERAPH